jgi:hypothetical protein
MTAIIEVVAGTTFFFLLLSLLCSAINEGISWLLSMRATTLEQGVRNLLNDPKGNQLAQKLYAHPLISSLAQRNWRSKLFKSAKLPPYIPARLFALALVDTIVPDMPNGKPPLVSEVSDAIALLPEQYDPVKRMLIALVDDADGDIHKARRNIEQWFDDGMDRVSGWYKRRIQTVTLIVGALLCTVLNADSLMMVNTLYRNATLRSALFTAATQTTQRDLNDTISSLNLALQLLDKNDALMLPLGWTGSGVLNETPAVQTAGVDPRALPDSIISWVTKMIGLIITIIAMTFGAPFWFSVLGSVVRLRLDGEPPLRATKPAIT